MHGAFVARDVTLQGFRVQRALHSEFGGYNLFIHRWKFSVRELLLLVDKLTGLPLVTMPSSFSLQCVYPSIFLHPSNQNRYYVLEPFIGKALTRQRAVTHKY